MTQPALLLDVDGVLCPFEGSDEYTWDATCQDWWSSLNRERCASLKEHFEVVWATAREDTVNRYVAPELGLLGLHMIQFGTTILPDDKILLPPSVGMDGWSTWKMPYIIAWAEAEGRPFAWVDDDIREDAERWALEREIPTLFLRIPSHLGLRQHHVDDLIAWAEALL